MWLAQLSFLSALNSDVMSGAVAALLQVWDNNPKDVRNVTWIVEWKDMSASLSRWTNTDVWISYYLKKINSFLSPSLFPVTQPNTFLSDTLS